MIDRRWSIEAQGSSDRPSIIVPSLAGSPASRNTALHGLLTDPPRGLQARRFPAILAFSLVVVGAWAFAEGQSAALRQDPNPGGFGEARRPAEVAAWTAPSLPEGLAMVVEILRSSAIGPGRGWYEKGVSKTRFDWNWAVGRLDRNRDGSIARDEFPGSDADFRRLDRDWDGKLTEPDFEFPANALGSARSRLILSFADRNRDGRLTGDEYAQLMFQAQRDEFTRQTYFADDVDEVAAAFKDSQKRGIPFLSVADLRETVDRTANRQGLVVLPNPDGEPERATRATLIKALVRRDIGSLHAGPSLGDPAPEFSLPAVDGRGTIALAKLRGSKPLVLVFGNSTDGVFRSEAGTLEKLYRVYRDRAEFLAVYVRESRPVDGWEWKGNAKASIVIPQPKDAAARLQLAKDLRRKFGLTWPMVVDGMDDRVGILYSGMPDRIYLLDAQGRVAYKSGRGPYGFKPDEVEQSLVLLLQADPPPTTKAANPAGR